MNNGARILLLDAEGNVSGGDRSADPRGGIFGAQGYGGGLFDGSTGLGQYEQAAAGIGELDACSKACEAKFASDPFGMLGCFAQCDLGAAAPAALPPAGGSVMDCTKCAALMLLPVTGPTLAAMCLAQCTQGASVPAGCTVPTACASAVKRFPQELPPELVQQYCGFPLQVQQSIAQACQSLAALPPGTVLPPPGQLPGLPPAKEEEIPPFMPGVLPEPKTAAPTPPAEASMAGPALAAFVVVGGLLTFAWMLSPRTTS
jgi:hypothetical protein